MKFIIDVDTRDKKNLMRRLFHLKTTLEVRDGGIYRGDHQCSQVWLETSWSESRLDAWLYRTSGIDYLGYIEAQGEMGVDFRTA